MSVTGDPTQALVDAMRTALTGDATLMATVTAVVGKLSEASRTVPPYLVLGRRHHSGDAEIVVPRNRVRPNNAPRAAVVNAGMRGTPGARARERVQQGGNAE